MKVVIPVDEDQSTVCAAFARAPYFMIYETNNDSLECKNNPASLAHGGAGIQAAQFIVDLGADSLITIRLGENSAEVLKASDINIYKSEHVKAVDNISALKNGKLSELTRFHAGFHGKL